jgi:hypothetical protein
MELGRRLSLLALRNEYDQNIVSSGPKYRSAQIIADKVLLKFTDVGSGLMSKKSLWLVLLLQRQICLGKCSYFIGHK